jgi:peroxiredoxin Q/BCP
MAETIDVGTQVADFALSDGSGAQVRLSELYAQGPLVLFFYPKDETFGCTQEVCAFRDQYEDFMAAGCRVVGVSGDTVDAHKAFSARHKLPYPLLADTEGTARSAFGVKKTLGLLPGRVTFVLDPNGVIRHRFSSQFGIKGHIQQALDVVRQITGRVKA